MNRKLLKFSVFLISFLIFACLIAPDISAAGKEISVRKTDSPDLIFRNFILTRCDGCGNNSDASASDADKLSAPLLSPCAQPPYTPIKYPVPEPTPQPKDKPSDIIVLSTNTFIILISIGAAVILAVLAVTFILLIRKRK